MEATLKKLIQLIVGIQIVFLFSTNLAFADRGLNVSGKTDNSEERYALVIGNADYEVGRLKNPVNDATDMAKVLRNKGFQVTLLTNAKQKQMKKAIKKFGNSLRKGGVGLFFYAGHGMQVKGVNYLIPIGAEIEEEDEIEYEAVESNLVLSKMDSAGNRLNMVFLDACRDNPFARSFRSSSKGLATMDAPSGTLAAFATAPGKTAADGTGRNGLFTGHLIKYMNQPGLPLTKMMMEVRKEVLSDSGKKQTPWDVSSLTGDFYFSGGKATQVAGRQTSTVRQAAPVNINAEEEFWTEIKNSKSSLDFQDYIETYPNGRFVKLAKLKLRKLRRKKINIEGNYTVEGTNPNGTKYRGKAKIWQEGNYFKEKWQIGKSTVSGKGHLSGKTLTIDWGDKFPVIYQIRDNGILDGTWANGKAKETLTLTK